MEFSWEDIFTCKFYKFMSVIALPDSNAKYSNPRAKNFTWIVIDFSTLKPLLSKKKKKNAQSKKGKHFAKVRDEFNSNIKTTSIKAMTIYC